MNPKAIDGVLLLLAFAAIVAGVSIRWGTGWALMCFGALLLLRLTAPYVYTLLRGRSDA